MDGALDHGGDLGAACARFGGAPADWLDLSTGINPVPWPVGAVSGAAWTRLPDADRIAACEGAARRAYGVPEGLEAVAGAGASAFIRAAPGLSSPGEAAIPGPTYNEHDAAFRAAGWRVAPRPGPATRAIALVNPNNPDGRRWTPGDLSLLAEAAALLVVDESFADLDPALSMIPRITRENVVVLRSFGKFYGLAGIRLGFAVAAPGTAARLRALLGPWPVSGVALEIGAQALADARWAQAARARIRMDAARLIALAEGAGWRRVGGAGLFETFETPDAAQAQARLAGFRIWSRIFPYSSSWLRLGLPGDAAGWARLEQALS